jgi:cephalosporin hydroxylase
MSTSHNSLPYNELMAIQNGTMTYQYRGIETFKNPFDLAIYPLLLEKLRPRTIIEIGSHKGGSALWFADQMSVRGLTCHVHSIDISPVSELIDPRISFYGCDGRDLANTLSMAMLAAMPRPWLIVEDADHRYETVLSNLRFFAPHLHSGDYLAVEDGVLSQMGVADDYYGGGPLPAIHQFLAEQAGLFEIDRGLCDWFGHNMTWNFDGYLRRL